MKLKFNLNLPIGFAKQLIVNWIVGVFCQKPNYPIFPINLNQLIVNGFIKIGFNFEFKNCLVLTMCLNLNLILTHIGKNC